MAREKSIIEISVDKYIQPFIRAGGFSGAVLMARGGRILLAKGYGAANIELNVSNTPQTKFQIASLSKSFTAAAIMMLEERGQLRVMDPLSAFISDYPKGDRITIHHLLTHTSGIPNVNDFPDYDARSKFPHGLEEIISWFKDKPLDFAPGERYGYSNSNYNLLAAIIEKASGESYGRFLKKNIFDPLDMKDTGHNDGPRTLLNNRAYGYAPAGNGGIENAPFLDWAIKTGNGSLYSTVEDLFKWDRALYTEKILQRDTIRKMFTEHIAGTGYGWFLAKHLNRRVTYYNGKSPGFTSYIDRFIDDDACIIILSNNYAPVPHIITKDLAAILFGEPYSEPEDLKPVEVDIEDLELLTGCYQFGKDFYRPEAVVSVERQGDFLVLNWGGGYLSPLNALSETIFFDRNFWARIIFEKDGQGRVTRFIWRDSRDYPSEKIKREK
jgi:CubicO group peptidase (beta-lactamase class C family)